ncbi:MAG: hypothetical protein SF172_17180 [Burkholderiales bacterium]|nr:hypothetical protein [Burkholderiales bacterium]
MTAPYRAGSLALLLMLALPVRADSPQTVTVPCARTDKACAFQKSLTHKVRTVEFWEAVRSRPLAERMGAAPPELVEYMNLDVIQLGIPTTPRAPVLTPDFVADVQTAVEGIPAKIRKLLDRRLAGIWFVEEIGGTGFSDIVRWGAGQGIGFIVLDPRQLMDRRANEWASWKENTPFRSDSRFTIEAIIAEEQDNNRVGAIRYILLHELAHVLATQGGIHPRWDRPAGHELRIGTYPFHALSWKWDEKLGHVSLFDVTFPDRPKVRYYFGANLDGARMLEAYRWLATTNFPTLYAATNPGDDFAESFVSYVHTVLMKRPWAIRILDGGKPAFTYTACWDQPRCAEKRKLLEGIIAGR